MTPSHSMSDADKPIVYAFRNGTNVTRYFQTIDVSGKKRDFLIDIDDEKGIESCRSVGNERTSGIFNRLTRRK